MRFLELLEEAGCLPSCTTDDSWKVLETGGELEGCLLYTSDAADDLLCVDIGGRRIIKKKKI